MNPFRKAEKEECYLKLFLFGDSGTGKTPMALSMSPKTCVIDLERGARIYADRFKFDLLSATTLKEVDDAMKWLVGGGYKEYECLVIDPVTVYWELLQNHYKDGYAAKKGVVNYEMSMKDWNPVKAHFKRFLQLLTVLPINVVCIAREKTLLQEVQNNGKLELKKVGTIFDSEKSTHYIFDTRVHLVRENGEVICLKDRDRTGILPERWKYSHEPIKKIIEQIAPKSKPENFVAPAESKPENGNGKHPPNYIPSPSESGWELFPIPDSYLYKEIRGKGITWDALAKDNGTICMDTKLNHPVKARYLLHKMLGFKEKPEIVALAEAILKLYPSEADKCKLPEFTEPPDPRPNSPEDVGFKQPANEEAWPAGKE